MDLTSLFRKAVSPRLGPQVTVTLEIASDDDELISEERYAGLDTITGLALVVEYVSASGETSQRLVTCRSLSLRGEVLYLSAFCHFRKSLRSFRVDRVNAVIEPSTGEIFPDGREFFRKFDPDHAAESPLHWGLHPRLRADLIALLTVLIFVARCDKQYHPLEREALEAILVKFWMHLEIRSEPDIDDILAYSDRLAPDGEAFWLSLNRIRNDPKIVALLKSGMRGVVEADGVVKAEEFYWVTQVEESLADD